LTVLAPALYAQRQVGIQVTDAAASAQGAQAELRLEEFAAKVLSDAPPLAQNTDAENLGFGWLYYSLVRNLRPELVVAIGSCHGFMPFCAARGAQDNGRGVVAFIDPSYSGIGHPGWGGVGAWSDPLEVEARIASFGLAEWITHYRMTSEEAFPVVEAMLGGRELGLVIVDGAHTREHSLRDFELYTSLMGEGIVVFHDSTNPDCEVASTLATLAERRFRMVTIHRDVGLTLVEISPVSNVETTWAYLCEPSNRAQRLLPYARSILRPGDRVLDLYCGLSPLAFVLDDVEIFGCDRDPAVIRRLRKELPHNRWERIDEFSLPFSNLLPPEIDAVFGLGVSRGRAAWDPQVVCENVRYLLGRYYPRACLFEAAAEYYDGEILRDLAPILSRLGYACRTEDVDTDLPAFSRRRVLLAERPPSS
jgi:Methyltransferase domain